MFVLFARVFGAEVFVVSLGWACYRDCWVPVVLRLETCCGVDVIVVFLVLLGLFFWIGVVLCCLGLPWNLDFLGFGFWILWVSWFRVFWVCV